MQKPCKTSWVGLLRSARAKRTQYRGTATSITGCGSFGRVGIRKSARKPPKSKQSESMEVRNVPTFHLVRFEIQMRCDPWV